MRSLSSRSMPPRCSLNSCSPSGPICRTPHSRPRCPTSSADVVTSAIFRRKSGAPALSRAAEARSVRELVPSASATASRFSWLMPSPHSARCSVRIGTPASAVSFSCVRFCFCRCATSTRPNACFSSMVVFFISRCYHRRGIEYHATLPPLRCLSPLTPLL